MFFKMLSPIVSLVAIITCSIAFSGALITKHYGWAVFMGGLIVVNGFFLIRSIVEL